MGWYPCCCPSDGNCTLCDNGGPTEVTLTIPTFTTNVNTKCTTTQCNLIGGSYLLRGGCIWTREFTLDCDGYGDTWDVTISARVYTDTAANIWITAGIGFYKDAFNYYGFNWYKYTDEPKTGSIDCEDEWTLPYFDANGIGDLPCVIPSSNNDAILN